MDKSDKSKPIGKPVKPKKLPITEERVREIIREEINRDKQTRVVLPESAWHIGEMNSK